MKDRTPTELGLAVWILLMIGSMSGALTFAVVIAVASLKLLWT